MSNDVFSYIIVSLFLAKSVTWFSFRLSGLFLRGLLAQLVVSHCSGLITGHVTHHEEQEQSGPGTSSWTRRLDLLWSGLSCDQMCPEFGPLQPAVQQSNTHRPSRGGKQRFARHGKYCCEYSIPLLYLHSQVTVFPIDQIQMQFRCGTTHSANCIMFLQFFVFILNVFDFKMSSASYIYSFLFLIYANMLNM